MNTLNQKSECCEKCWQKAWTSTKGNFMHCCYPECKCHSPTVATSEKECNIGNCLCNNETLTPNESEDWSEKISKYQNECLKHFESYRGNVPAEKDFTHSLTMFKDAVRNEAYQRGREEVIDFAVQEIEKEKKCIFEGDGEKHHCYSCGGVVENCRKCHKDLCDNKKCIKGFESNNKVFNEGLDKAKSIISGLIKK